MEVFHPNCTFPGDEAGIVATPDMRGTIDIVWSCLAVVLLCTWVVLHENVPAEGNTHSDRRRDRLFLEAYLIAQKTCSFAWVLFAPELFTVKAMMGSYFARHVRDIMKETVKESEVDWTTRHAFLANMGGFAIEFGEDARVPQSSPDTSVDSQPPAGQGRAGGPVAGTPGQEAAGSDSSPGIGVEKQPHTDQDGAGRPVPDISEKKPADIRKAPSSNLFCSDRSPRQLEEQTSGMIDSQGVYNLTINIQAAFANPGPAVTTALLTEAGNNPSDALRRTLLDLYKKYDGNKWFIFPIPKVVLGRWREDRTNLELIKFALVTATFEKLGFHTPQSYLQNLMTLRGNIWVVDGIQLEYARRVGIISAIPGVTEDEIMDKSKGDWVSKALAILQVTWLWIQLVLRTAQGLTATQLEIMTAAFATCSVITYALYLQKPKDIKTRIRIQAVRYPSVREMAEMGRRGPRTVWFNRVHLQLGNDNYHHREGKDTAFYLIVVGAFIGMVFGSVHFACWDSHFPTLGEKLGWRIACGILLLIPVPVAGLMLLDNYLEDVRRKEGTKIQRGNVTRGVTLLFEGVYVLARLFMMVEAGRSLYFQPKESFVATWAFMPHV